jgi:acetyl-CoA C-acetyltransferase
MREVAIIGTGMTRCGELWDKSLRNLWTEAALAAIEDAGVDHIDSMYIGCMSSGLFVGQEHLASLCSDYLGMNPVPATHVESACASGGLAMKQGILEVASGHSDIVLVSGVEKMLDIGGDGATYALATAADREYEAFHGITFPGLYAMIAVAHMHKYGTTREQLAAVAVKNHFNGSMNPLAQFPFKTDIDGVINAVKVADPLTIMDCSPITDGAAAVIICPADQAAKLSKNRLVKVKGFGHATGSIALASRKEVAHIDSARLAAEKAYKMAGVGPADISVAEVHDCFTIAEVAVIEALGFVEYGQGGPASADGLTALDGKIPINPSGGLKSKGHPVGATGVYQIIEIARQLRGECGKRQVNGAKLGLTQNMGGTGGSSVVHILEAM